MNPRRAAALGCALVANAFALSCGGTEIRPTTPTSASTGSSAGELAADRLLGAFPVTCVSPEPPSESIEWLMEEGDLGDGFLGDVDPLPPIEAFRSVDGDLELRRDHDATAIHASLSWVAADKQVRRATYDEVGTE